jgi:hypothetical protein
VSQPATLRAIQQHLDSMRIRINARLHPSPMEELGIELETRAASMAIHQMINDNVLGAEGETMTEIDCLRTALAMACEWGGLALDGPPNGVVSRGIQSLIAHGVTPEVGQALALVEDRRNSVQR